MDTKIKLVENAVAAVVAAYQRHSDALELARKSIIECKCVIICDALAL
jgi:hypothetical protein